MIFYFSATGNSKFVVQKISEKNGDTIVSIGAAMKTGQLSYEILDGEDVGFVTPVYFWGIPDIVNEFLKTVKIKGHGTDHYVYHVVTFGSVNGGANAMMMSGLMRNFGLQVGATYAIRMVDNWVPGFDCSDAQVNLEKTQAAIPEINKAAEEIAAHELGEHNFYRGAWALLWPVAQLIYEQARKTKHFQVTDDCIGCGLCERQCPCNAIQMGNNQLLNEAAAPINLQQEQSQDNPLKSEETHDNMSKRDLSLKDQSQLERPQNEDLPQAEQLQNNHLQDERSQNDQPRFEQSPNKQPSQVPLQKDPIQDNLQKGRPSKTPVWIKPKCTLCFGCLHRCPEHAIRYGKSEKAYQHGQFVNPLVKL